MCHRVKGEWCRTDSPPLETREYPPVKSPRPQIIAVKDLMLVLGSGYSLLGANYEAKNLKVAGAVSVRSR